jgi:hypothetical protein
MIRHLKLILVVVLGALIALPAAQGYSGSHGIAIVGNLGAGHGHELGMMDEDSTTSSKRQTDEGKHHNAKDHAHETAFVQPIFTFDMRVATTVGVAGTSRDARAIDFHPPERPPRIASLI